MVGGNVNMPTEKEAKRYISLGLQESEAAGNPTGEKIRGNINRKSSEKSA